MPKNTSQAGRTMIEIIGVLTVIGLVTVTIAKTASSMLERYRNSRMTMQIVELQRAIKNRFAIDEDFTDLTLQLLHDEKLVPSDLDWKNDSLYHKFGGTVTVGHNYTSTALDIKSGQTYYIQFTKVPQQACLDLLNIDWATDQYSDLVTIISGNLQAYWFIPTGADAAKSIHMPISISDAGRICSDKTDNTLKWVFQ